MSKITNNARQVLEKRYLVKDAEGNMLEDVDGMFSRVANAVSLAEQQYVPEGERSDASARAAMIFKGMMENLDFLPNSPTLMNAGRPLGQLSACFVLPVEDDMMGIFEAVKNAALIHKSGGGTGFSFSRLRSNGSTVQTTGGVASGPVSFMKVFNAATEAVKQGGTRRGANMGILRVDHPDIMEFITCKNDTHELNNFNLSIGITEAFMRAVASGASYELVDPHTKKVTGTLNAKDVFQTIVESAWQTGEPGIVFLDRMNQYNPTPDLGEIESTNPCGEQPLLPNEACNLGSINLLNHVKKVGAEYVVDEDKLKETVQNAVRFLDDVIDVNQYPLPIIGEMTKRTRKVGLGIMGFADLLLKLGIPYNSQEAINFARKIMRFINDAAWDMSQKLAETRGPFPAYGDNSRVPYGPVRNATVTTIAPTGTLSIIAGVSSGVEPVFAFAYIRNVMDNSHMVEVNPILEEVLRARGLYTEELMREISEKGSLVHVAGIPDDIKRVFVCAHDVSPEWHVKMQAAFQEFTDNAVSKTVNFPNSATREDVALVYRLAYELGCKGVTIYRDGSRDSQVLNIGEVNDGETQPAGLNTNLPGSVSPRLRPPVTQGFTEKVKIGCGNLFITVNSDEHGVCEVFTNTGKAGGCPSQSEATARLASIAIRSGVSLEEIVDQLKGIRCPSCLRKEGVKATSCPDAIARCLMRGLTSPS